MVRVDVVGIGILEHHAIHKLDRARKVLCVWAVEEDLEADAPHSADVDGSAAQEEAEGAASAGVVTFEERAVEERGHC